MAFQTINPTTNKVIKSFDEMTDEAVDIAVAEAVLTFDEWEKTNFKLRAQLLYKVAGLLRAKKKELAQMITLKMGKLLCHAEGEIKLSAEIFDYYAKHAERLLADKILNPFHGQAFIRNSPMGMLLGIEAWNFFFYQVTDIIDTGLVFVNHPIWTQADLPFGGTEGSGYGREMAALGLEEFVNKKLIRISELSDPF